MWATAVDVVTIWAPQSTFAITGKHFVSFCFCLPLLIQRFSFSSQTWFKHSSEPQLIHTFLILLSNLFIFWQFLAIFNISDICMYRCTCQTMATTAAGAAVILAVCSSFALTHNNASSIHINWLFSFFQGSLVQDVAFYANRSVKGL